MSGEAVNRRSSSPLPRRIRYGPEQAQFGELYLPAATGPWPVVILIHGGYWRARYDLALMDGLATDLAERGYAAWNIEYRRVGDSGGGWPGTFLDVSGAADFLRELSASYSFDLERVVSIGHSAGGHLALWLAARPRIPLDSPIAGSSITLEEDRQAAPLPLAGAISLAGVLSLETAWRLHLSNDAVIELLGEGFADAPERYIAASPAALLPLGVPQVLLHGTNDAHVPIEISQAYAREAQMAGDSVTYLELEGIDHFDLIDPRSSAWHMTIEQLRKLVSPIP